VRTRIGLGLRQTLVLAAAGALGGVLAVHGWSARHSPTLLGSQASAARASAPARASSSPSAAVSSSGPTLRSQSFASYAYLVWPGRPDRAARAALAGLSVTVHRQGTGLSVLAGVNGQQQGPPHYYPLGAHVYVIEASLGDDSGNSDYNLGDDGLVVTDAHGRIVT
jgi:hypothetical protein